MMVAASALLLLEGAFQSPETLGVQETHVLQALGCVLGMVFIVVSKRLLSHHEELKFNGMQGTLFTHLVLCRLRNHAPAIWSGCSTHVFTVPCCSLPGLPKPSGIVPPSVFASPQG